MSVIATLVVGCDGSTTRDGSSRGLSTPPDRRRFLITHRSAGAIVIGPQTAEADPYLAKHCPVYVLSRRDTLELPVGLTHLHTPDNSALIQAMQKIRNENPDPIVVESGAHLLTKLVNLGLIDVLQLSISPLAGDSKKIEIHQLLDSFNIIEDVDENGTRLLECRYKGDTTDSK
jgi:riboflavin biosynthesis pyrimidine reductase